MGANVGAMRAWTVAVRAALACFVAAFVMRAPKGDWPWDGALFGPWKHVGWLVWTAAGVAGLAFTVRGETFARWMRALPRWRIDVALAIVTILVVRHTSFAAFHNYPQVMDEIAYDLLGRRISIFHPIPSSGPLPDFFRVRFMVDAPLVGGRDYPLFQPGWPMVIAVGYWLHVAKIVPAIATAALVIAGSRLGERLYGRFTGVVAGLFLLFSGFVGWVGASYFAHAWSAALYAIALERAIAALEDDLPRKMAFSRALAGGLFAGWLVVTRVSIAAALLLPLAATIAFRAFERRDARSWRRGVRIKASARRPIAVFALATMLGVLAQMAWNGATTGHAFELPQDRYFALTEPNPTCHRLGFGDDIGCPREHPNEVPQEGYTPARALEVDRIRWETFRTDAWGCAVPLLLVAIFCARRWRGRDVVIVASAAGPIAISTLFYYHAIHHGVRLWTESMPALGVMIASVVARPFAIAEEKLGDQSLEPIGGWRRVLSGLGFSVMLLAGVTDIAVRNPQRAAENSHDLQPDRITKNLDRSAVHHAIVYMRNCIDVDRGDMILGWASVLDAVRPESGDRWFVRDFGSEMDRQLVTLLPDWRHVRATCDGIPIAFEDAVSSPRFVVSELEAKFPMEHVDAYDSIVTSRFASDAVALRVRTKGGGSVRFAQHVFEGASYDVTIQFVRRLDGGRLRLSIDGSPIDPPLIGNGNDAVLRWTSPSPVALDAGDHVFELRSPDGPGVYVVDLDRLELRAR
jgi:hypothetical protein